MQMLRELDEMLDKSRGTMGIGTCARRLVVLRG
jgi:hypothetical protein